MVTTAVAAAAPEPTPSYDEQAAAYRTAYTGEFQRLASVLPAAGHFPRSSSAL